MLSVWKKVQKRKEIPIPFPLGHPWAFTLCVWGMLLAQYNFPVSKILILTNLWTQIICSVGNHSRHRAQYRGNHSHLLQNGVERRDGHHAGSLVIKTPTACARTGNCLKSVLSRTNFFCIQLLVNPWWLPYTILQFTRIRLLQQSMTFR